MTARSRRQQLAFQITSVVLTGGAFAVLWSFDLFGSAPLWLLLLLLPVAALVSDTATRRWGADCNARQMHARIATHIAMTTLIIYIIGWGPTLAVGYLVPVTGDLDLSGSKAWRPCLVWGVLGIGAGQLAIAARWVSTRVDEPLVHGIGALSALGLAFVVYLLGTKTMEIERAESELQATASDLAAANAAMQDFVAVASHELRTPTTVVKGFASTMQARWSDITEEDRRDYLSAITRSADQLGRLIEDLLTVSKIDAGVLETALETVDLRCAVENALFDVLDRPDLCLRVPPALTVAADPEHLRRIVRNYVDNALTYGAPPFVIDATRHDDRVELRVRDGGDGLPREFVGRAFEKFAHARPAMANDRKGTGLGLSIVRGLARAGGGDAWYEDDQTSGRTGACFVVSFPAVN